MREPLHPRLLPGAPVRESRVQIDIGPEPGRRGPLEGVRNAAPAAGDVDSIVRKPPEQSRGVARIERRSRARREQPCVEDAERRCDVSCLGVEHGEMPGVVRTHAAFSGPMRALIAQPLRAVKVSPGLDDRVRHRVHAQRTGRVSCQRLPAQRLGVCGVAVLGVRE